MIFHLAGRRGSARAIRDASKKLGDIRSDLVIGDFVGDISSADRKLEGMTGIEPA